MAKGYWIARVDVTSPDAYQAYLDANGDIFHKYGALFLVRGGAFEAMQGRSRSRNIVLEFKDYATALACYRSPEYQKIIALRQPHSVGEIIVIEGCDGQQP